MINPILFRGGMYGDLILGILDPSSLIKTNYWRKDYDHSTCAKQYIKYTRTYLKKFFNYTDQQKYRYYNTFNKINKTVYFLTHDTDFSMNYKEQTVQIICSDLTLFNNFAERFERLHRPQVINETKKMIENKNNFVESYKDSLILWQNAFKFPKQFDIKNIFKKTDFIKDLQECFDNIDVTRASSIYDNHFGIN